MRNINTHKVNPANDLLEITVTDEEGAGGANHRYEVTGFDASNNPSHGENEGTSKKVILFQNGPINEKGVNGLTQEVLIAICIDRLQAFQAGQFSCRENALALTKLEEAQMWLQKRTQNRMARNVEGTHKK